MLMTVVLMLLLAANLCQAGRPPPPPQPPEPTRFNATFSDYAVLQAAPSKAAVYGVAGEPIGANGTQKISVMLSSALMDVPDIVGTTTVSASGEWISYFPPQAPGGDWTVTARCTSGCKNTTVATLEHVVFGDVWYCAGQSNMWLPLHYTYSRNHTVANISAGAYDNIRLMAGDSQKGTMWPWKTAKQAIANSNASAAQYELFDFSAACWYWAETLTAEMKAKGETPPQLGLISTAIGGSMIEEWLLNETIAECQNLSIGAHNQMLYDQKVRPYLSMSVRGFLWYQGENDMHGVKGNVLDHTGYACAQVALVKLFREKWSVVPGTTDPEAPFGIVAIPPSGTEGGPNLGAMNIAQTGSYGSLPNAAMPNTFIAETYDLNDPWGDKTCYGWGCCNQWEGPLPNVGPCLEAGCNKLPLGNATACQKLRCPGPFNDTNCQVNTQKAKLPSTACDEYCKTLHGTPVFMYVNPALRRGCRRAVEPT